MPYLGEISALLTAVLWSGSSVVFAVAANRVGSMTVNIGRLVLAALYLSLVMVFTGFDPAVSQRQVMYLSISGVIGLALGDSFLFRSYREIGPRVSMLVMSSAPAIGAILAFFFLNEVLSSWSIIGMAVTLAGIAIVVLERKGPERGLTVLTGAGVVSAFLGAVGQGTGLIFAKLAFNEGPVNGFLATFIRIIASLVVLLPVVLATGRLRGAFGRFNADRRAFWLTAGGSVVGPFLGIALSLVAVAHTSVGIAATLMATVPILMLPLVRMVYKERLTWRSLAGAWLAVAGVAILFLR
jgi:drug/metabolite transporter (DMT)-like permease